MFFSFIEIKNKNEKSQMQYIGAFRFYPFLEAIIISLISFAAILISTYFIYYHALNGQKEEICEGLLRTALVAASFVDGDIHQKFINPDQEKSVMYEQALVPLQKILKADASVAYVYTVVMKNGKVYFVLDPTPAGDVDNDGIDDKSHIMQEYEEVPKRMLQALKTENSVVEQNPWSDRWGNFLSAYVPVYNSHNKVVAILGVDIRADNYYKRLEPIKRATIRAMVTGFFISFLIGSIIWFTRKFLKVMNHSCHQIYQDYLLLKNK